MVTDDGIFWRSPRMTVAARDDGKRIDHATACARMLNASWQRCRAHFMHNVMAHADKKTKHSATSTMDPWIGTEFAKECVTALDDPDGLSLALA